MTKEIKQRIEQIKNGEVPQGYKKTKIGIVPNEWEEKYLRELLEFKNGFNAEKEKFGKGTKLISVLDILADRPIMYDSIKNYADVSEEEIKNYSVTYGDVLFQRSSENFEDAGMSNVYLDSEKIAIFSGFVIRGKKISEYNPIFLNNLLKIERMRKIIRKCGAGAQHINIGQKSLSNIIVVLPPLKEQQKISEILSTQDKVIELKEKLLNEKEKQKKYLMQNLLTGKKRLKGFNGEWNNVKLGDITSLRGGFAFKSNCFTDEGIPIVKISNILQNESVGGSFDFYEEQENDLEYLLPNNAILLAMSGATTGKVAILKNLEGKKIYQNQRVGYFRDLNKVNYMFISFIIRSKLFINKIKEILVAGAQPNISSSDVDKFVFNIPKDIKEQKAIAEILTTADKELKLLQEELEEEKRKKKALMQLLLTGIVRVKV